MIATRWWWRRGGEQAWGVSVMREADIGGKEVGIGHAIVLR